MRIKEIVGKAAAIQGPWYPGGPVVDAAREAVAEAVGCELADVTHLGSNRPLHLCEVEYCDGGAYGVIWNRISGECRYLI